MMHGSLKMFLSSYTYDQFGKGMLTVLIALQTLEIQHVCLKRPTPLAIFLSKGLDIEIKLCFALCSDIHHILKHDALPPTLFFYRSGYFHTKPFLMKTHLFSTLNVSGLRYLRSEILTFHVVGRSLHRRQN